MTTASLAWRHGQETISGGIAATLAMDRVAWEAVGATFTEVDDGDGERPWLAVGEVEINAERMQFGVLDYGDDITHLLVGGPSEHRANVTTEIVSDLIAAGAIPDEGVVLEIIGLVTPASVDDKLDYLVDVMETQLAEVRSGFDEQVRLIQAQIERLLSSGSESLSTPHEYAQSVLSPLLTHGLRDLQTLPGTVHSSGHEGQINVVVSASIFPIIVGMLRSAQGAPDAHLVRYDPTAGEALITIDTEGGRVPLIIVGLAHGHADFDAISLPPLPQGFPYVQYSAEWPTQPFGIRELPEPRSHRRRRIHFRIIR